MNWSATVFVVAAALATVGKAKFNTPKCPTGEKCGVAFVLAWWSAQVLSKKVEPHCCHQDGFMVSSLAILLAQLLTQQPYRFYVCIVVSSLS